MKLKKLDVGDITAYERRMKEQRRAELIATFKDLYGDNMPSDAVMQIDRELKNIPSIFSEKEVVIDADAIQFLLWRSLLKSDSDATFESAGELINTDDFTIEDFNEILPVPDKLPAKKKKVKKARKKKPKDN